MESSDKFDDFMKALGVGMIKRKLANSVVPINEVYRRITIILIVLYKSTISQDTFAGGDHGERIVCNPNADHGQEYRDQLPAERDVSRRHDRWSNHPDNSDKGGQLGQAGSKGPEGGERFCDDERGGRGCYDDETHRWRRHVYKDLQKNS